MSQETYLGSVSSTLRHTEDASDSFFPWYPELSFTGEYPARVEPGFFLPAAGTWQACQGRYYRTIVYLRRCDLTDPTVWTQQTLTAVAKPRRSLYPPRVLVDAGAIMAFVAAILATNYALTGFPNVKLFDLLVFVAGYTLGFRRGAGVAVLAWAAYGTLNPWGATTGPLLVTVMAAETVYAGAGAVLCRFVHSSDLRVVPGRKSLGIGAVAVLCTLVYDGITNVYAGFAWAQIAGSADYSRWLAVALFNPGALFFTAAHVSSNLLFFGAFAPLLIKGAARLKTDSENN